MKVAKMRFSVDTTRSTAFSNLCSLWMCTIVLYLNGTRVRPCGSAANRSCFMFLLHPECDVRFKCDNVHTTTKHNSCVLKMHIKFILKWENNTHHEPHMTPTAQYWTTGWPSSSHFHTAKWAHPIISYRLLVINLCNCATKRNHYMWKFMTYM